MPIMDFFTNGGDGLTLNDMIECDMKSNAEYLDHLITGGDPLISSPSSYSLSVSTECSQQNGISSLDDSKMGDMSWLQQTVNVNEIQGIVTPENTDPNLLVNPQTGLPVSSTSKSSSDASSPAPAAITVTQATQIGSLGNAIIHNPSNNNTSSAASVQFVSSPVAITAAVVNHQQPTVTYMQASPSTSLHQNIQNNIHSPVSTVTTYQHQTLTQHLLNSNNNRHKLTKSRLEEKVYPKPVYSYSCLIAMALKNSDTGALPVSEIYSFMTENFPYFKNAPDGWKNSVRHNLSLNKCFEKIENPKATGNSRKGCLWGLNPLKIEKMEEEITKWRKKDPVAVKRSMARPDKLEVLEKGNIASHSPHHPNNIQKTFHTDLGTAVQRLLHSPIISSSQSSSDSSAPSTPTKTPGQVQVSLVEIRPDNPIRTIKLDANQVIQTSNFSGILNSMTTVNSQALLQQPKQEPDLTTRIVIKNEPQADAIKSEPDEEMSSHVKEELQHTDDSGEEDMDVLSQSLIDPSLSDIALHVGNGVNGIWDELSTEGITLDDLPISSSNFNFSFSTNSLTSSPATVQTGVLA